ncbi:MAG: T9SS type A sorting domain-containing protein [Bacteroidetes bacterium]|nr:T9SS type A sorting domain-containing protein [Bacteroidota bacterium]
METEVEISSAVLTDTSTNTLAQFSSITLRKALTPLNILRSHESYLNIYPNPVKSNYFLNIESDKDCLAGILISDIGGRKVLFFTQKLNKGMNVIEQSSSKLNSGSYFVRANFNNSIFCEEAYYSK